MKYFYLISFDQNKNKKNKSLKTKTLFYILCPHTWIHWYHRDHLNIANHANPKNNNAVQTWMHILHRCTVF